MLRFLIPSLLLCAGSVSAQGTLGTWDRYTIIAMTGCVIDGLTSDDLAQAAARAVAAASLTDASTDAGTFVLTHSNGTTMTLTADDGLACDMTIPKGALPAADIDALETDIRNQIDYEFGPGMTTEDAEGGQIWTVQGKNGNTITTRFAREPELTSLTSTSRPTPD